MPCVFSDNFFCVLLPQRIFYFDTSRACLFTFCRPRRLSPDENFLACRVHIFSVRRLCFVFATENFWRGFDNGFLGYTNNFCRCYNLNRIFHGANSRLNFPCELSKYFLVTCCNFARECAKIRLSFRGAQVPRICVKIFGR